MIERMTDIKGRAMKSEKFASVWDAIEDTPFQKNPIFVRVSSRRMSFNRASELNNPARAAWLAMSSGNSTVKLVIRCSAQM